ncbi:alpha/beta-hydrolase [Exidia glandulosa HHB12029]|uniref:Alpha/beta-hydrolase n=1 Tax=Exidia glandulosa HHB12029 TaxID=1314781 RepID=A0A165GKB5_EXIGL|nr:alpha/beta-hydrolase [Exidia glandulosa HHB12029]
MSIIVPQNTKSPSSRAPISTYSTPKASVRIPESNRPFECCSWFPSVDLQDVAESNSARAKRANVKISNNRASSGNAILFKQRLPRYWVADAGYVVVRIDERGFGQSPGSAAILSSQTWRDFAFAIEWAAEQSWSNGKVALLGVSYYAMTQWGAAALRPKGLVAMIPWEGACDMYGDMARHGGIFSNGFIDWWWKRQVNTTFYGAPGRAANNWGPDTIECTRTPAELAANTLDWPQACRDFPYADAPIWKDAQIDLEKITTPLLSVNNWGGTGLHPRGNFAGYVRAASTHKWLFIITGRHDLPFYRDECVALQRSFLDAFCKGLDDRGWINGPNAEKGVPAVRIVVREPRLVGVDDEDLDRALPVRDESAWPLPGTQYIPFYVQADGALGLLPPSNSALFEYAGLTGDAVQFSTLPFDTRTEMTGHPVAHLYLSLGKFIGSKKDFDVFVTLRHIAPNGNEVLYTGTSGQPASAGKGWLRASVRFVDESHPLHEPYLPHQPYTSDKVSYPEPEQVVEMLVEVWAVHFVLEAGARFVLEVSPKDTEGTDIFTSFDDADRSEAGFGGVENRVHVSGQYQSRIIMPVVPAAAASLYPDGEGPSIQTFNFLYATSA